MGAIIRPGMNVLLKPNWVLHRNETSTLESLVTHPSVIRAVPDYVAIALWRTRRAMAIWEAGYLVSAEPRCVMLILAAAR